MMTMTTEPDCSSNAVLATATLVGTVESSQKQHQRQQIVSITPVKNNSEINEDGKGIGVAMFVLQLVGLMFMIIFQSTIGTSFEQGTLVSGILLLISIISTGLFIWDRDTPRINAMPVEVISDR